MTEQTIDVTGLPEGYRLVCVDIKQNDRYRNDDGTSTIRGCEIVVEKIQPRRIVLEETEEGQPPNESQWLLGHKIGMFNLEKKWRVVEEE